MIKMMTLKTLRKSLMTMMSTLAIFIAACGTTTPEESDAGTWDDMEAGAPASVKLDGR